jgi:hypothetical protein
MKAGRLRGRINFSKTLVAIKNLLPQAMKPLSGPKLAIQKQVPTRYLSD